MKVISANFPAVTVAVLFSVIGSARASESALGAELYGQHCAACHEGGVAKAPHIVMLQTTSPESILESLQNGVMRAQAAHLSNEERRQVAEFIGGRPIRAQAEDSTKYCDGDQVASGRSRVTDWGMGERNNRHLSTTAAGVTTDQVDGLKLKWAFAYPDATRARSQPTVVDGRIYVGSQDGTVYALDLESGCAFWRYQSKAEVRSAIAVETNVTADGEPGHVLYFGDFNGNIYALNAKDGSERWVTDVDDHPDVTITGSPKLHEGTLYVPMSSREWATAVDPYYNCCTFRGGVVAFNVDDGSVRWKSRVITEEPKPTGRKNPVGTEFIAPAGAPVWNSPTIDKKRGVLYVGTGQAYSSPAPGTSNSVIAMDLKSGAIRWVHQALENDAWNMACNIERNENCPEQDGPDLDIGAATILYTAQDGKDYVLAGQKSGDVFALDPDKQGALVWKNKIGRGGFIGGIHWGMSVIPTRDFLIAPNADTDIGDRFKGERKPGVFALKVSTGEVVWNAAKPLDCPPGKSEFCDTGVSASVTTTENLVFAGGLDGYLRIYDAANGQILWEFDTDREFATVSGAPGRGGSIESDGPVIVDGNILVNSGYLWGGRMPGNVLLNFSYD